MAGFIASGVDPLFANDQKPCITFPRIIFGARESTAEKIYHQVPEGFNVSFFHTLRFRKHGVKQFAQHGKSLIDVSRYSGAHVDSPHAVVQQQCNYGPAAAAQYTAMAFRVHHYTGSLGSFLRVGFDARGAEVFHFRNKKAYERYSNRVPNSQGGEVEDTDDTMRWWLSSFVDLVGKDNALRLTQRARWHAQLETKAWREKNLRNHTASF